MNACIHLCTTVQAYFYSTIFEKGLAQQRFLGVAPLANNLYQRAWARRQIDAAEPHGCILQFIWSQESRKGISEIEGKAVRVAASEAGAERVSIQRTSQKR